MVKLNINKIARYCLIAFWVLVVVVKAVRIPAFYYPAILIGLMGLLIGDDTYRIGFCLMLVPNIRMFDTLGFTYAVNIMMIMPLIAKIIMDRKLNTTALAHTLLLMTMELAHILYQQTFEYLLPNMAALVLLYYIETILLDRKTKINFPEITRKFAFGSIFSAVVFFIINFRYMDMRIYLQGYRYTGYSSEPNYYSLYICLTIAMIFIIRQHKVRDYVYIGLLMFIEIFTLSKMALLTLLIILFFIAMKTVLNGFSYRTRFLKRFLVILIAAGIIFSKQIIDLVGNTIVRFRELNGTAIDLDSITTLRSSLMTFYFNMMLSDPVLILFGYGMQYNEYFGRNLSHNTFFDILLSWGIPGVFLFFSIFFTIFRRLLSNCPERITVDHFFPMFILFLTFFALSCLSASMFWWVILAAFLPLKGIVYEDQRAFLVGDSTGVQRTKIRLRVRRVAH